MLRDEYNVFFREPSVSESKTLNILIIGDIDSGKTSLLDM